MKNNGLGIRLSYHLAKPPEFVQHHRPEGEQEPLEWLYDEIDMLVQEGVTIFHHSIRMTNGLELGLWFPELYISKYRELQVPGSRGLPHALETA